MKRLLAFFLGLALLLCGCGQTGPAAEESPAPKGTPVVYMPKGEAEKEPTAEEQAAEEEDAISFEEWLEEMYVNVGSFSYNERDYEAFLALNQGEETRFNVSLFEEFFAGEEEQALQSAITEAGQRAREIYLAVEEGEPPEGNYQVDRSLYPEAELWANAEMLDKLPEEWYALQKLCNEKNEELLSLRSQTELDCCLSAAQAFSDQGCEAQVYGVLDQDYGQEYYWYVCFVTMSPEKMWELGETMEGHYFIEPCYEGVALRCNIPVWPEG